MNRKLLFLPIFVLSLFLYTSASQADALIFDIESNFRTSITPFNSGTIETGSSSVGDYILIACAVPDPADAIIFSGPSPGNWTNLDIGSCGTRFECASSIWGTFVDTPNSEEITCSWTENQTQFAFAAGSMRFSGVDANDPIIDIACASGSGTNQATAPSIETEAGSNVVRIWAFTPLTIPNIQSSTFTNIDSMLGAIEYDTIAIEAGQFIASHGLSEFFANAGPTGTSGLTFSVNGTIPTNWRACTIGLRMGTPPPPVVAEVPTISEWGMITFAAFAGIAGFWFIRRRQLTA